MNAYAGGMQRIYELDLTPEEYEEQDTYLKVEPETQCPSCFKACPLHRLGFYERYVTNCQGVPLRIRVARFVCSLCRRSISYLPVFALSYRVVNAETLGRFLEGDDQSMDVQRCRTLLLRYLGRMRVFLPTLISFAGCTFDWMPRPPDPSWKGIKKACGSFAAATRQLVHKLAITMFARYQCHQSASAARFIST